MISLLLGEGQVKELGDGLSIERREGGYELYFWRELPEQYSTVWISDVNAVNLLKFLKGDLRLAEYVRIKTTREEMVERPFWKDALEREASQDGR